MRAANLEADQSNSSQSHFEGQTSDLINIGQASLASASMIGTANSRGSAVGHGHNKNDRC
jgi:hypothetical protein